MARADRPGGSSDKGTGGRESSQRAKGGWMWPGLVFVLLGMSCTLVVSTIIYASSDGGAVIVEDYYEKSLQWDAFKAERAQSDATGWSHAVQVSPAEGEDGGWDVLVRIVDRQGAFVEDASVMLTLHHALKPRDVRAVGLRYAGNGAYVGTLDGVAAGVWKYDVDARGEGDRVLLASGSAHAVGW